MTETKRNKRTQDIIRSEGGYIIKVITANDAGTHDMLACIPVDAQVIMDNLWALGLRPSFMKQVIKKITWAYGRFCSLEGKLSYNKMSALQIEARNEVIRAGGLAAEIKTDKDVYSMIHRAKTGFIQNIKDENRQLKSFTL